jgi:hypothetical protein
MKIEKLLSKADQTLDKLDETKETLDETNETLQKTYNHIEIIAETVVPPQKLRSLDELFTIYKLNDSENKREYKVACTQQRTISKSVATIKKAFPKAELLLQIDPTPNTKNILHRLKDKFGQDKFKFSYNFISLINNSSENELLDSIRLVENEKCEFVQP